MIKGLEWFSCEEQFSTPQQSRLEKRQLKGRHDRKLRKPEDGEVAQTSSVSYPVNSGTS